MKSDNARSTKPSAAIKIGLVTSLSGIASPGGREMVSAMKLFLEQVDYQIAGRKVDLIIEDDQHSVAYAIDKMRKLHEKEHVHVLIGTISSNIAYGIAPSADAMKIPMILPITGADDLTKRTRHNWLIRTGFSSSQLGHPFADYVYNHLKYSTVAAFGLDYALGWEIVGSFQKTFEELGGKVIQKLWASQSLVDFSRPMKELNPNCDAVFFSTSNNGSEAVAKSYHRFGPKLPMIGGGPGFDETVLADVGDLILGAVSACHYSGALDTPEHNSFAQAYKDRLGPRSRTSLFSEGTYTACLWLKKAIEAVDGNVEDRTKFLQALKAVELIDAPRGPMKLDEYGNPIQNVYVRKVERINGIVQNTVIHTYPNVSQFWHYDPVAYMKQPAYSQTYSPTRE